MKLNEIFFFSFTSFLLLYLFVYYYNSWQKYSRSNDQLFPENSWFSLKFLHKFRYTILVEKDIALAIHKGLL